MRLEGLKVRVRMRLAGEGEGEALWGVASYCVASVGTEPQTRCCVLDFFSLLDVLSSQCPFARCDRDATHGEVDTRCAGRPAGDTLMTISCIFCTGDRWRHV